MKNYTKKPVTIQAVQWNGQNIKEIANFMKTLVDGDWVQDLDLVKIKYPYTTIEGERWVFENGNLMIKTLEGTMLASIGDYIIRGVKEEYYPCKPDIFELTYDAEQDKKDEPRFVVKALESLINEEMGNMLLEIEGDRQIFGLPSNPKNFTNYINIQNQSNKKGVPPIVSFTIQSDPISEVGVNGVQVLDMLRYCLHLFNALNDKFPCDENDKTTTLIAEAIYWQQERTLNRQRRGVEGKNEA